MPAQNWAAVIPAYNAGGAIQTVVAGVSCHIPPDAILVVDDGSSDKTAEVVRSLGVSLLSRVQNGGKGRALRDGFTKVLGKKPDWILCLDADGQHDPTAIPQFIQAAESGRYDLVIGDRTASLTSMPLSRRFSNRTSSFLLSLRTGLKLPDVQCGFRAFRSQMLNDLSLKAESYEIEVETILRFWARGGRIGWVPIPTIYRGEQSFIRKVPETFRFLRLLLRSYQ